MTRIDISVVQASLNRTVQTLEQLEPAIGRRALRTGVFKAGAETLKQARAAAPTGRTGQFRRSLAKKDLRFASKGTYISLVGQNRKKVSTQRQIASARRRTGMISRGLSGQGHAPPIHFLEKGTSRHAIKPQTKPMLWWNIVKGGRMVSPRAALKVVHTGHAGTAFLERTEARYRRMRLRMIQREILVELRRMGVRLGSP